MATNPFDTIGPQGNHVFQGWSCILLSFAPCQAWRHLSRMSSVLIKLGEHNPPAIPAGLPGTGGQQGMTGNGRKNKKAAPANRQCRLLRTNLQSCRNKARLPYIGQGIVADGNQLFVSSELEKPSSGLSAPNESGIEK